MHTYYLIDQASMVDEEKLFGELRHLVVFNPGPQDLEVQVTVYYQDREPTSFTVPAHAGRSSESNTRNWPVPINTRFAIKVESPSPLVCQCTGGWNVNANQSKPGSRTHSPFGMREAAKSYVAVPQTAREWYVADGIVIDNPGRIFVRESEWALVLNADDKPAVAVMTLHYDDGGMAEHKLQVPARRLLVVYMDEVAQQNKHYGVHLVSDQPIIVQWLRNVNWYDREELMAFWSVPGVPAPLP